MSKEQTERKQNAPKTIKVSTLVKGVIILLGLILSFLLGWYVTETNNQAYNQNIVNVASAIFKEQSK